MISNVSCFALQSCSLGYGDEYLESSSHKRHAIQGKSKASSGRIRHRPTLLNTTLLDDYCRRWPNKFYSSIKHSSSLLN